MRFIKFNYSNGNSFAFSLDYLSTFESNGEHKERTKIVLIDGREESMRLDVEDFAAKAFSDLHETEYQLIEIDEEDDGELKVVAHRDLTE